MGKKSDAAFATFDENLSLDPRERERAQQVHNDMRDAVSADGVVVDSLLQGSFARKTMLRPLEDVDVVLLPNPSFATGTAPQTDRAGRWRTSSRWCSRSSRTPRSTGGGAGWDR